MCTHASRYARVLLCAHVSTYVHAHMPTHEAQGRLALVRASRFGRLESYGGAIKRDSGREVSEVREVCEVASRPLAFAMVLSRWRTWAKSAPTISWWSPERPVRVATDCTGLGVVEMALETLASQRGVSVQTMFACDIWSASQRWLQGLGV